MKPLNLFIIFAFFISYIGKSQIIFSYDNGGNIIERKIQIINPNARLNKTNEVEKDSVLSFKIYPNPTNDKINIEGKLWDNASQSEIFIRSNNGMLVRKEAYDGTFKTINVSDLSAGIYFLEVKYSKRKSANYKIVITN